MLIDDDEGTNYLNKVLLQDDDRTHDLHICDSSKGALEYLNNAITEVNTALYKIPNLILLDINMPCMNGWEFLEEYKLLPQDKLQDVKIVMLTTSLNPLDKRMAEKAKELSAFEHKPLTTKMIENIFDTYF